MMTCHPGAVSAGGLHRSCRGRLPVYEGLGSVGPVQHGDGRGAGDGLRHRQEAYGVGGAGDAGTYGWGEQGVDGGPQVTHRGEGTLVEDEGPGVRQRLGVLPEPGGETGEVAQVVGDAAMTVVP